MKTIYTIYVIFAFLALNIRCTHGNPTNDRITNHDIEEKECCNSTCDTVSKDKSPYFDEFLMSTSRCNDSALCFRVYSSDKKIIVWDSLSSNHSFTYTKKNSYWVNYICKRYAERVLPGYTNREPAIIKFYSRYIFRDSIFELERVFHKNKLFSTSIYIKTPANIKCIYNVEHVIGEDTLAFMRSKLAESRDRPLENADISEDGKVHAHKSGNYILCYPTMNKQHVWPGVNQDIDIVDDRANQDGTVLAPDIMPKYPGGENSLFNDLKLKLILNKYAHPSDRPAFRFLITTTGTIVDVQVYRVKQDEIIKDNVLKNARSIKHFSVANNRGVPVTTWYTLMTKYDTANGQWNVRPSLSDR